MPALSDKIETHAVDPARLAPGAWCHHSQKTIGQGDIYRSYSADRIGMGQPVRKPFEWRGGLWVCVSISGRRDELSFEAYRLVDPCTFEGHPVTYAAKTRDADAARSDPSGFYHGMIARHAGREMVLCGAPVSFKKGEPEQRDLFDL